MCYAENSAKIEWYCNNFIGILAMHLFSFWQCVGINLGIACVDNDLGNASELIQTMPRLLFGECVDCYLVNDIDCYLGNALVVIQSMR